jgi:hypothetical protein
VVRPAWLGGSTAPQNSGWRGFRGGESSGFSSGGHGAGGWSGESACGQFARRSPLVLNTRMGGVVALRWRGGTTHSLPFVVLVSSS